MDASVSDCLWSRTFESLPELFKIIAMKNYKTMPVIRHFLKKSYSLENLPINLTVCSYHVTYMFQSEFTLYSCLNVKELLAQSRRKIWRLSDCNWTRNQNHLVHKRTINHLAKLAKWLSCVVSTYLYGGFDCMFLSCHIHVSE